MANVDVRDSGQAMINIVHNSTNPETDEVVYGVFVDRLEFKDGTDIGTYRTWHTGTPQDIYTHSDHVVWLLSEDYVYTQ